MAAIEAFETALKDVVKAKRLSQSKMTILTEVALKNMKNDTQMVSILYRTHKGLPPAAKISSLYAFDALARAARSQVNRRNLVANVNAASGNCATFLLKIEGILDGLFHDLVSSRNDELKEKAKKILDIWTKSNTFPSAVLSPLSALLQEAEQEKEPDKADQSATHNEHSTPFGVPSQAPVTQAIATASADVDAVQSTLLALLSQAANAVGTNGTRQTATNTGPVSALDATQLALLQQLAQTAKGNTVASQPVVPVSASVVPSSTALNAVPVVPPLGHPQTVTHTSSYRDDHHGPASARRESEQQFAGPADHQYTRDDYHDHNREYQHDGSNFQSRGRDHHSHNGAFNHRGGYRDRGVPGRGRGRGRWDERGDRDYPPYRDYREGDLGNGNSNTFDPRRTGRRSSRSRSPTTTRYRGTGTDGSGHDGPPRRTPPYERQTQPREQERNYVERYVYAPGHDTNTVAGFDEFGRELRARSPSAADGSDSARQSIPQLTPPPPRSTSATASDRNSVASESPAAPHSHGEDYSEHFQQVDGSSASTSTSTSTSFSPSTSTAAHPRPNASAQAQEQHAVGLDAFDLASFNPALPASWDALGKAWAVTHGSMPTQEELVQFVFMGMSMPPADPASGADEYGAPNAPYDNGAGSGQWRGQGQYNSTRGFGQRGGWRGRGGDGGSGANLGRPGRGYGRGRGGDYGHGRGGGRGDRGRDFGQNHGYGRGDYVTNTHPGYGSDRGAYGRGYGDYQETDAVTLTGDDEESMDPPDEAPSMEQSADQDQEGDGDGSSRGKMQKVGDKWVFVRNGPA